MDGVIADTWVEVDGLRIHCLTAGGSGSPVVLLHGGGLDSAALTYRYAIGPLAEQHVVLAPDLPGYGLSDAPEVEYTLEYYVSFLGRLLDALGLAKASVVGLSLGGGAALGFALQSPERVDRLVLVDSYGLGSELPFGALSYVLIHAPAVSEATWELTRQSRALVRWSLESSVFGEPDAVTDDLVEEVYQLAAAQGAGRAFISFQRSEAHLGGLRTSFADRLGEIAAPTLIVHGTRDRLVPLAWARRAHERIAGSELEIIPECGHWPPRERPDEFSQTIVGFLADG